MNDRRTPGYTNDVTIDSFLCFVHIIRKIRTRNVLKQLKIPQLKQIFKVVVLAKRETYTPSVENVYAIILLRASERIRRCFEEAVYKYNKEER